jgi:hypothetical protein
LPRGEKWRAHRTLPAVDFFNSWSTKYARLVDMLVPNEVNGPTTGIFRTRAKDRLAGERLAQETGPLEEWRPDMRELVRGIEDDQVRQRDEARWQHVVVSQILTVAVHVLTAKCSFLRTSTIVSYNMGGQNPSTRALAGWQCSSWKSRHGRWRKRSWTRTIRMPHCLMTESSSLHGTANYSKPSHSCCGENLIPIIPYVYTLQLLRK